MFAIAELLGGAAGSPCGGCAGSEDDGGPGAATPAAAVEGGGSDPVPTAAGGAEGEVPPLTAGLPASPPAAVPGGEQLGAGAPPALAVQLPFADPAGSEHEPPEFSPDGLTVGPLPVAAVPVDDGVVVVVEDGRVSGGPAEVAGGWALAGESGAVPASEPMLAEQSVAPAELPPLVESPAAARGAVSEPASAAVTEPVGGEQGVSACAAPDMAPMSRTHTASESRQILLPRRTGDGTAERTMR